MAASRWRGGSGRGDSGRRCRQSLDPGAGVVKGLNPFCRMGGRWRSFLDIHLAKTRAAGQRYGIAPLHVVTSGYLTDAPLRRAAAMADYARQLRVSKGAAVGLRMIPTLRDLQFLWEEVAQQVLDPQKEKMRQSIRAALMKWAADGRGSCGLHGQSATPMPASRRSLVRDPEFAAERNTVVNAGGTSTAPISAAPQHRHAGRCGG
ncbi:MAG UNVERIFIED_CONTAM: hypothetical protein LVR18_27725 [Planctomycetaceae bacterium]